MRRRQICCMHGGYRGAGVTINWNTTSNIEPRKPELNKPLEPVKPPSLITIPDNRNKGPDIAKIVGLTLGGIGALSAIGYTASKYINNRSGIIDDDEEEQKYGIVDKYDDWYPDEHAAGYATHKINEKIAKEAVIVGVTLPGVGEETYKLKKKLKEAREASPEDEEWRDEDEIAMDKHWEDKMERHRREEAQKLRAFGVEAGDSPSYDSVAAHRRTRIVSRNPKTSEVEYGYV